MSEIMSGNITRLELGDREFILLGTAHVSRGSVEEVGRIITEERPDRVCVEIDNSRYASMTKKQDWSSLNIYQVIKQKKGFLLLGNLVLASFQRRLGMDLGVKPGEEMLKAVETSQALDIPVSFSDREIQITLRRAWAKTGLWGKSKLLSAMLASVFTREKLSPEEIEELKKKSELEGMMDELAGYLPSVKEVLIDERDTFLAANIFRSSGKRVLAVAGAGHIPGIIRRLTEMHESGRLIDTAEIQTVPRGGFLAKALGWLVPAAIAALIIWGFFSVGKGRGIEMLWIWLAANGGLAALGSLLALAHPLTILASVVAAPIATLNPAIGVGMLTGLLEAYLRKPRVEDFENLHTDIASIKGFFRNRFTHVLLVFLFSSLGGMAGNFIALPYLTVMAGK
ncbi:MAG: TraB/GumN family protein [Spirochaetales bacterium]|jgi:pheromone shutdown-related protein TraB|nr:TraB/GumN family protein [Spirochaetales bacterium]